MKTQDDKKLDNPVWFSLSETHQSFAIDYGSIKFYHSDYCPFGGFEKDNAIAKSIDEYSMLVDSFFIVGEKPELSNLLKLNKELVCLQMIVYDAIDIPTKDKIVRTMYNILVILTIIPIASSFLFFQNNDMKKEKSGMAINSMRS